MHWLEATKNNRHVPKIRLGQKTLYKTIEIPIGQFLVRGSIILDTWLTRYRNEEREEGFEKVYRMPGFIVAPRTRRENNTMYH